MEYVMQFAVIAAVYYMGEGISFLIPLPIPGTVYGLVLLFVLLCTGLLKLEQVEKAGDFLLSMMPILFVPGAAAVLEYVDVLAGSFWQIVALCGITTFSTLLITGYTAKLTEKYVRRRK